MMLVTPLCIVDGTYMGSLLVVWGGIASAVLLILIFTVSYWVGRRIAKAPDRPGKEVLRWKSTHGNASGGVWSAGTPGAPC